MLQELIDLEKRFQPFLHGGDYTFIGPTDAKQFEDFIKAADNFAPSKLFDRTIHHALSDKQATWSALQAFVTSPLQVYVISAAAASSLIHGTIDDYCNFHNITFPPDPDIASIS